VAKIQIIIGFSAWEWGKKVIFVKKEFRGGGNWWEMCIFARKKDSNTVFK
jgi:hypothetical protein